MKFGYLFVATTLLLQCNIVAPASAQDTTLLDSIVTFTVMLPDGDGSVIDTTASEIERHYYDDQDRVTERIRYTIDN